MQNAPKTALILTGHMRCWETCFPNTKEYILDRFNPDVFIHTWDTEGYWVSPDQDPEGKGVNSFSPPLDKRKVVKTYKPVPLGFQMDSYDYFEPYFESVASKYLPLCQEIRPKNTISQFYKMHEGIAMMERYSVLTNTKYDLVIRMRPDLIFHNKLLDFDPEVFYNVYHRNHTGLGTGDMFFASSQENMMIFKNFVHYYDDMTSRLNRFCPHMFVEDAIKGMKVEWQELSIPKTIQHSPNGTYQNYTKE